MPLPVWLDVDTSTGVVDERARDVDDGLALLYAFHSPELELRGVSVCFGNVSLPVALPLTQQIVARWGPPGLAVYSGAAGASDLGVETPASRALEDELHAHPNRPLHIVALAPVTNIATVLRNHPHLAAGIASIVICAARRPGFDFHPPGRPDFKFPDANFEKDAPAMQVLLDSGVPLIFAGYEASCDTWLTRSDLESLAQRSPAGAWIAAESDPWLRRWEEVMKLPGFNPFDVITLAFLTHPDLLPSIPVTTHLTTGPDDRNNSPLPASRPDKPYLICHPARASGSNHRYVTRCLEGFHPVLLQRLSNNR